MIILKTILVAFQLWNQTNTYHQTLNLQKLFSYIKSIRTDNSGVAPLKRNSILITDTVEKADILNNQFQSVCTNELDTDIPVTLKYHRYKYHQLEYQNVYVI